MSDAPSQADIYILNLVSTDIPGAFMPSVLLQYEGEKVPVRDAQGHVMGHGIKRFDGRDGHVNFLAHKPFTEEEMKDVPTILYFQRSDNSSFGDFAKNSSALILSRKAAAVVQSMEPGKHQYFPLKVKAAKRYKEGLQAMGHVVVNVCQTAQAVDIERSNLEPHVLTLPPPYEARTYYNLPVEVPHICVDPRKAKGLHIWGGGKPVLWQELFVSRALRDAWTAAGCGPLGYIPCRSI